MLNIVALSCLVSIAMATRHLENTTDNEIGVESMNVIRFPSTSVDANSTGNFGLAGSPRLTITIWLPNYFTLGESEMKPSMSPHSMGNSTLEKKPPKSIQLWLNRTSRTEVRLGPNVHRSAVEIYGKSQIKLNISVDAVDARWIQSTRSCRQRYVCDHSCDPGAGHACICQRGYRPAGPEDRSRLIGYGTRLLSSVTEH